MKILTHISSTLIFAMFSFTAVNAVGKDLPAKSCDFLTLEKIAATAKSGDTIVVPPGYCDWSDNRLIIDAGITLRGSGKDATVLYRSKPINQAMIGINCRNGESTTVSGLTLIGFGDEKTLDTGLALMNGCSDFRVFGSRFSGFGNAGIEVSDFKSVGIGYQRGVIYNNEFIDNYKFARGYGVSVYGSMEYSSNSPPYGSKNFVFIEDNFFSGNRHAVSANFDALYVFRYNTAVDNRKQFSVVDAHGKTTARRSGTMAVEIYENRITHRGASPANIGVGLRGGEGVVFNNRFENFLNPIALTVENYKDCWNIKQTDSEKPRNVYVWGNQPNSVTLGLLSGCASLIQEGRYGEVDKDFFRVKKPSYKPFTYPHPLRSIRPQSPGLKVIQPKM